MNYLIWGLKKSGQASLDLLKRVDLLTNKIDNRFYIFDDNVDIRSNFKNDDKNIILVDELTKRLILKMDKIILSPAISINEQLVQFAKEQNIDVVGELELAYSYMDKTCTLVAITGTNGKTTTTELVYEILKNAKIKCEKVGNIGIPFSSKVAQDEQNVVYVCETSSFQLESCKTFHPNIACLINISPDHLDRHNNMDNYLAVKKSIFSNQNKYDYAIVPASFNLATKSKKITFGTKNDKKSTIFVKNNAIFIKKRVFSRKICNLDCCKNIGEQYIENALCAISIAKILGVKNKIIYNTLNHFLPNSHRLQLVYLSKTGNKFFDDSKATNVASTIKATKSFDSPTILLCGGSDKNCDFDDLFLDIPNNVQKIFVFGETADKLLSSHKKTNSNIPIEKCENLCQAVYLACQEQNKIILLSPACASFDEFISYKERGEMFLKYIKDYYENF